jgi:MFS family permease
MSESHQAVKSFFIFSILSALFALSMFFRVSNAVIAPNLVRDLSLDAEALGVLGGAYFYSFTLLQIPMGPMLDRIGPRMVVTVFPLIGGLGSFLFAFGGSFPSVFIGRILIGVGMASVMMSTMKIFIERFPSEKFSTLLGMMDSKSRRIDF